MFNRFFGLGDKKKTRPAPITGPVILSESPWSEYNADMRNAHDLLTGRGIADELDLSENFCRSTHQLAGLFFPGEATTRNIPAPLTKHSFFAPGSLGDTGRFHQRPNIFANHRRTIAAG